MRMKTVVCCMLPLAALSLRFARTAEAGVNCGRPGPNQVVVWQNYGYSGACDVLGIGNYPTFWINALSVGNEGISAVRVGSNVKVTLYENNLPEFNVGDWLPLTADRDALYEFNDKTSAIRVESRTNCPSPGPSQVVVYSGYDFTGHCDVIDRGFPVTYAKILGLSVGNDTISSVACGTGVGVRMWEHDLGIGRLFLGAQHCSVGTMWTLDNTVSGLSVELPGGLLPAGTTCTAGPLCASNVFCEAGGGGTCDTGDGVCTIEPTTCSGTTAPVCGCDGITYLNDCERQAGGVRKLADGYCP